MRQTSIPAVDFTTKFRPLGKNPKQIAPSLVPPQTSAALAGTLVAASLCV